MALPRKPLNIEDFPFRYLGQRVRIEMTTTHGNCLIRYPDGREIVVRRDDVEKARVP